MVVRAKLTLELFGSRASVSAHNMHGTDYLDSIVSGSVGVVTSSLAIHHCNDAEKSALYKAAFRKLTSPGAFIIIDAVRPISEHGIFVNKKYWEQYIREQSRLLTGADKEYEKYRFVPSRLYEHPAEEDKPATFADNLRMLTDVGFKFVECFWMKCGFAIFGGYK